MPNWMNMSTDWMRSLMTMPRMLICRRFSWSVSGLAIAAVAAFDAVGSIIVIAMFICPPAAARLITDTMAGQMVWSIVLAVLAAVCGYLLAAEAPLALGWGASVSAAGMIATVGGLFLMAAALWGPRRRRDQSPA